MHIGADGEASFFDLRANVFVDRTGRYGRFDNQDRTLFADIQHLVQCRHQILLVQLFGFPDIRRGHGDQIGVRLLVFCAEADALGQSVRKQIIQPVFLKGQRPFLQRLHQVRVQIGADHIQTAFGKHQRGRQADITQSNYIDHIYVLPYACIVFPRTPHYSISCAYLGNPGVFRRTAYGIISLYNKSTHRREDGTHEKSGSDHLLCVPLAVYRHFRRIQSDAPQSAPQTGRRGHTGPGLR